MKFDTQNADLELRVFLMQFVLLWAVAFVSSPIHLLTTKPTLPKRVEKDATGIQPRYHWRTSALQTDLPYQCWSEVETLDLAVLI